MSTEFLELRRHGEICVVELQRPNYRNALHAPLWREVEETARKLAQEPPRATIITGSGGNFCSGMDLKPNNPFFGELTGLLQARDEEGVRALLHRLQACFNAVASIPSPVIAAIEGTCVGGGVELALAADIRIASRDASFSLPEATLGMLPDVGGAVRLSRCVGRSRVLELILSGRAFDGMEARSMGLVLETVEPGEALGASLQLAQTLLRAAPAASRYALELLRMPEPTFTAETEAGVQTLLSGEVTEGIAAFAEKRRPNWAPEGKP